MEGQVLFRPQFGIRSNTWHGHFPKNQRFHSFSHGDSFMVYNDIDDMYACIHEDRNLAFEAVHGTAIFQRIKDFIHFLMAIVSWSIMI